MIRSSSLLTVFASSLFLPGAFAIAVFNFDTSNTNIVSNNANTGAGQTIATAGGVTTFTNQSGGNNNSGIASISNISTLLGRSVNPAETVILELEVDSIIGDLSANGIEFGLSPNGTGFRPGGHLIAGPRANNSTLQFLSGGSVIGGANSFVTGATEASLLDGFGATLTLDASGFSFVFDDVIPTSGVGTSITTSGTFASAAQFTAFADNAHFYLTAQKSANPDLVLDFSLARLSVVPEPSRAMLLLLGMATLLLRRRAQ